jgi:hypothetical protein
MITAQKAESLTLRAGDIEWIPIGRAARRLAVSIDTIRSLIRKKRLTVRAVPGAWPRVLAHEIDALAESSTTAAIHEEATT